MATNERVKVALLIGAPNGLKGVEADVAVMARALKGRGFDPKGVCCCVGAEATRDRILGEVKRLANNASMYSEVVIFYSGHGGRVMNPRFDGVLRGETQRPRFFAFVMPSDVTKGGAGDFRGILVAELESYFQQIVDGGARLTVIFDCCHAAAVVRSVTAGEGTAGAGAGTGQSVATTPGPGYEAVRTLSLDEPYLAGLPAHFERLDRQRIALTSLHGVCSPLIVRLTASGEAEAAFERATEAVKLRFGAADPVAAGAIHGVMTAALVRALAEVGDAVVPWHVVGRRARALAAAASRQQVMLRGPHRRIIFSEKEDGPRRVAGIAVDGAGLTLDVGAMCGVEVGDRFFVWPREVGAASIGEVRVVRVDASRAWVERCEEGTCAADDERLANASVSPAGYARPRARVRCEATSEAGRRLLGAVVPEIGGVVEAGSAGCDAAAAVEVIERDGWLEVRRPGGGLLREPADFLPERRPEVAEAAIAFVREAVEAIAIGHALVQLASGGSEALRRRVAWSIERRSVRGREVFDARALARPLEVEIGDHLLVDVRRVDGAAGSLFVWVLMVGPGGRVSLLSSSWPTGAEITDSVPFTLGRRPDEFREGVKIDWPLGVPRPRQDGDRRGWIVLVLADGPADLTMWETEAVAGWRGRVDRLVGDSKRARTGEMPEGRAREWAAEAVELEIDG